MQLGGLYDPGVEDVGEEAGHAGGQDDAEQGGVVDIDTYLHISTHLDIYTYLIYLQIPANIYTYQHISRHI